MQCFNKKELTLGCTDRGVESDCTSLYASSDQEYGLGAVKFGSMGSISSINCCDCLQDQKCGGDRRGG